MKRKIGWMGAILAASAALMLFTGGDLRVARGEDASILAPAGLMLSEYGNIIASTPSTSKLVVYGFDGGTYQLYSTIEPESGHHFDIGDVDNDPSTSEIAVARFYAVGPKKNPAYEVCVTVYKEGFSGIWRSCCSSITNTMASSEQVLIADVDNDSLNEILVLTHESLVIFKYSTQGLTVLSSMSYPKDYEGLNLNLQSVRVSPQDVNGDGLKEIYVSAIIPGGIDPTLRGYLMIFPNFRLSTFTLHPSDGQLTNGQLRVGDITGDGDFEICSPGCDYIGGNLYRGYIYVWDKWGNPWTPLAIPETDSSTYKLSKMDIGELRGDIPGLEIAICLGKRLDIYDANNYALNFIVRRTDFPMIPYGGFNEIRIWDSNGDGVNEINVGGATKSRGSSYGCYLGVFNAILNSIWEHAESPRNEGEVFHIAIGK